MGVGGRRGMRMESRGMGDRDSNRVKDGVEISLYMKHSYPLIFTLRW